MHLWSSSSPGPRWMQRYATFAISITYIKAVDATREIESVPHYQCQGKRARACLSGHGVR